MVENNAIIYLLPWIVFVLIGISLMIQGYLITNERCGYSCKPGYKRHPEIDELRGDTGRLMTLKFDRTTEANYHELAERIQKVKMEELFDEPSTYEDEPDEDD